jgi:collagenase-like PrtC family protease
MTDGGLFPGTFRFCVPYFPEEGFAAKLAPYRHVLDRVYVPIPPEFMGSGRPWSMGDGTAYAAALPGIVTELQAHGLCPELLCNAPLPAWDRARAALPYVARLAALGLRCATVAYLPFAALLHRELPDLELTASTVAFIHDPARLERWLEEAAVTTICPDRSVNKDLAALRVLRRAGVQLRLVVDDGCLPSCPSQFQHYQLFAENAPPRGADLCAIEALCGKRERARSWRLYQLFIVPASLPAYAGIADGIKLGRGRSKTAAHLAREMQYYMDQANRHHLYAGYHEPDEVLEKLQECDRICHRCEWCRRTFAAHNTATAAPEAGDAPLWERAPEAPR